MSGAREVHERCTRLRSGARVRVVHESSKSGA